MESSSKNLEKEKRHRENQRKIYEKMFTEGLKIQDVQMVMEKYMERENMKNSTQKQPLRKTLDVKKNALSSTAK